MQTRVINPGNTGFQSRLPQWRHPSARHRWGRRGARTAVGFLVYSADTLAAADALPSPVGAGSVLQVFLGLAIVLGMVFAAAWVMRRFNPNIATGGSALRIVAGTAVGNRERVLLVEVNDTWLVVGVAPGQVSPLHTMPKPENFQPAQSAAAPGGFAGWLKQTIERRNNA